MDVDQVRAAELFEAWRPWLKYQAEREAETRLRAIPFSEFVNAPQPPEFVERAEESAYRRGYWHGYSQAMDDIERANRGRRSKAWMALARFFDGALTRWRYEWHNGQYKEPPTFDSKA